jgi:hypothetical protein
MKQLGMTNLVPENSRVGDVNQGPDLVRRGQVTGRGVPGLDGERSLSTSLREGVLGSVSRVLDKICIEADTSCPHAKDSEEIQTQESRGHFLVKFC